MLERIFESLEINRDGTRIYLELLESGSSTAGALAKKLGIARATLYDMLKKLTDKGAVNRSLKGGVRTFRAETPENLNRLFEKQIENLQLQQHSLNQLIPALSKGKSNAFLSPRFEFFEGLESVKYAMQDFLFHYDIESYNYWHVEMIDLLGQDHFFYSNKKRLENNITQKLIVAGDNNFTVKKYPFAGEGLSFKRQLRIAPPMMSTPMSYWIYKNKVLFLSSRVEAYACIIESYEMANMMREQFMASWAISKKYIMSDGEAEEFIKFMNR